MPDRSAGGPVREHGEEAAARWNTQTLLGGEDVPMDERGDCVRAALTSILGLPLDAVENVQGLDWWQRWQEFVGGYGFELLVIYPKQMFEPPAGFWLAVVPSLTMNGNHCVVAKGRALHHDPGMALHYTDAEWDALWEGERVLEGWLLVPFDPAAFRRAAA